MIFTSLGNPNANAITTFAGLVFLAFFSAKMALQFFRDDVVLAILPTGISDARWNGGLVEWDKIKQITLRQHESEFELGVYLWPQNEEALNLAIDLGPLESDVDTIVSAITIYMPVRSEY